MVDLNHQDMSYSILLVEDDELTRNRLQDAINSHQQLQVCKAANSLSDARKFLKTSFRPSIGLIDIGLPDGSGLELIHELTTSLNPIDCMVISILGDEQHVIAALSAGATGYILKDSRTHHISNDIITLINGGSPISPKIARHLLKHFKPSAKAHSMLEKKPHLTLREKDILLLISKGYKRKEIALSLQISINTVSTHINSIYRKLAVNSNIEAIRTAFNIGLL